MSYKHMHLTHMHTTHTRTYALHARTHARARAHTHTHTHSHGVLGTKKFPENAPVLPTASGGAIGNMEEAVGAPPDGFMILTYSRPPMGNVMKNI